MSVAFSIGRHATSVRCQCSTQLWTAARLTAAFAATVLGLIIITFVIGRVIPIDPVLTIVGERAPQDVYQKTYLELGLDKPLAVQFWIYLRNVLGGDFGTSVFSGHSVLADLLRVFPATVELATLAMIIGIVLGIPLGIIAACYARRWPDDIIRIVSLFGHSMPIFWLGIIGLQLFYGYLGWVGGPGRLDIAYTGLVEPVTGSILIDSLVAGDFDVFRNALSHICLPALLLGYHSVAYIARMTRSLMLAQLGQEYVLTARAKGVTRMGVVLRHAFRNVIGPLATVMALTYGSLLEGAVLTETVFSWPGLGLYMKNALFNADMNAILGATLVIGTVYIALNLMSDLVAVLSDPRRG